MKHYQEVLPTPQDYGLFLVKNRVNLNEQVLAKIHGLILNQKGAVSFERLLKGGENVLAIYLPRSLKDQLPELDLLELEDYLASDGQAPNKINPDQTYIWQIASKNNPKKELSVKGEFLKMLDLAPHQQFCFQIVSHPQKDNTFQVTIRGLVVDQDPTARLDLAKRINAHLLETTGLQPQAKQQTTSTLYEFYQKRSLVPKEISKFILSLGEVRQLLG